MLQVIKKLLVLLKSYTYPKYYVTKTFKFVSHHKSFIMF